jgi:hypothetical protein
MDRRLHAAAIAEGLACIPETLDWHAVNRTVVGITTSLHSKSETFRSLDRFCLAFGNDGSRLLWKPTSPARR